MTGKVLRKGNLLEAAVILERDIKVREEITLLEIARIRHVIIGILNENRDATSVKSGSLCTEKLTVSLTRNRRRMVVKDLLPY